MRDTRGIFIEKVKRTPTIESFRFNLEEKIDFLPGQFLQVIFDEGDRNNHSLNKFLSFSSAPGKDYIEVTKRLSDSEFSKALLGLKQGDEVLFKAPMGNCVLEDNYRKIAFLIGGIGITPVISILEYIADKKLDTDVLLFYSNKTEDDIAFREELNHWRSRDNIKVFFTVTDCESKDTNCIRGRINKELLMEEIKDAQERIFFIFGPPKMVEAMKSICLELDCRKENVKTESFIGY